MANINKKAFDYLSSSTDNTKAEIFKDNSSISKEDINNTLEIIGAIPGIGEPADLLNALLYGSEGKYSEAALSIASIIPIIGGSKNAKKLLDFAKSTRLEKAKKLANEMTDKGSMTTNLRKPLQGKYKDIDNLMKEIDLIDLEIEKDYYMRTIGRIPNLPQFKKGK
jgi:hypothetical protein